MYLLEDLEKEPVEGDCDDLSNWVGENAHSLDSPSNAALSGQTFCNPHSMGVIDRLVDMAVAIGLVVVRCMGDILVVAGVVAVLVQRPMQYRFLVVKLGIKEGIGSTHVLVLGRNCTQQMAVEERYWDRRLLDRRDLSV